MSSNSAFDAIIVGGGHNGLAAAAYLAKAGRKVLLLEKLEHPGGAAVSAQAFDGVDARLSRYSYLVSLLPQQVIDDLGLRIRLARRRYSSYTPDPHDAGRALLIDNGDDTATAASFAAVGAPESEFRAFTEFYAGLRQLTEALWPTMTSPLPTRSEARDLAARAGAGAAWDAVTERPIGDTIAKSLQHDLVRGVVLTDALIGTFARADDEDLQQNICFLYHLVGGGTGDWDVPVGGMGAVSGELERAAREAGATILTSADVTAVRPGGVVSYRHAGADHTATASWVLANVAPVVLDRLRNSGPSGGTARQEGQHATRNPNHLREGAQVKVNLLLKRLPRLLDETVSPEAAFGGTFHINETWSQLDAAYLAAAAGTIPDPLPCEIYCHSLDGPHHFVPGTAGRRRADPHGVRPARPGPADHPGEQRPAPGGTAGRRPEIAELGPGRAHRGAAADRPGRTALHRNQDDARHRTGGRHAAGQHLPRRPRLALRRGQRAPGYPGAALGRRDG